MSELTPQRILFIEANLRYVHDDDGVTYIEELLADRRARIAELAAVTAERDAAKNMMQVWHIRAEAHRQGADAAESALAARDAEVGRLREALKEIADTENPEHYGNARDALHSVRLLAEAALTPPAAKEPSREV